jgi:type II secretory pathway component PulF
MSSNIRDLHYNSIADQDPMDRPIGFDYHGWTISNREVVGFISCSDAPDERVARLKLEKAQIKIGAIQPRYAKKWHASRSKVTRIMLADFAGKLAEWLDSGQTMPMALRGIGRSTTNLQLSQALEKIADNLIDEGMNPAPAFREYNDIFPDLLITAIQVGHEKGDYSAFLRQYEESQREYEETIKTFKGAMVYPAIVLMIGVTLAAGLIYYVLPKIEKVLITMMNVKGSELPLPTRIVLDGGCFLASWPGLFLIIGIILVLFLIYHWAMNAGHETIQRKNLYWPIVGSLLRDHHAAYVTRMIGMLIDIDVLTALRETRKATTHVVYREMLEDVHATILAEGLQLSDALAPYGHLMGPEFQATLLTGQQATGGVDHQLIVYSNMLQNRVRRRIKNISKFVEPGLTVLLGATIVLIIAAVYLPITDITKRLAGG